METLAFRSVLVCSFLGLTGATVLTQAPGSRVTYETTVEMVALNVTVTTPRKDYVKNLSQDDFVVYEDGVAQPVSVFGAGEVPLDLALLLDVSASVRDRLHLVRAAAKGFMKTLRPEDRGAVIGFNENIRVLADWTADQRTLAQAVESVQARGGTSLYSAIYVALRGLQPAVGEDTSTSRRRAIVVLSDGEDTSSLISYEDLIDSCRRSGVMIYTIRVARAVDPEMERLLRFRRTRPEGEFILNSLARETGARAFTVVKFEELPGAYAQIAEELAHQYYLGYVPAPISLEEREFHAISVTVPGHADAQARTRLGYVRTPLLRKWLGSPD